MSTYGKTLKKLIEFSGAKLSVVAEEVGYDVSYISKWCNKGHLPAAKMAPRINRTLASLFASEILGNEDLNEFNRTFSFDAADTDLEQTICELLKDSYRASKDDSKEDAEALPERSDSTRVLTHANEIYDFFHRELPETVLSYHEACEIICTLDLTRFLGRSLPELPADADVTHEIRLTLAMDERCFHADSHVKIAQFHRFLSRRFHLTFDIYSNALLSDMNLFLIRDHMAVFCSITDDSRILTAMIVTDKEAVREIYTKLHPVLRSSKLLLHATDPVEFYRNGYRTDFYSRNHFQIFLAYGFEFLLPKDCWQSVIQTAREKYADENIARIIERLQITWEEIFERGSVEFFVTKSSLIRYIETGEILFADVVHRLTPEQRKSHIANILELSKNNPNLLFYVIDEERLTGKARIPRMSVFNNRQKAFIKNPSRYTVCDVGAHFYSILCDQLIDDITAYFDALREEPFCIRFDGAALSSFYEKYSPMILRMIDLS